MFRMNNLDIGVGDSVCSVTLLLLGWLAARIYEQLLLLGFALVSNDFKPSIDDSLLRNLFVEPIRDGSTVEAINSINFSPLDLVNAKKQTCVTRSSATTKLLLPVKLSRHLAAKCKEALRCPDDNLRR
jgi:hypothetical protein